LIWFLMSVVALVLAYSLRPRNRIALGLAPIAIGREVRPEGEEPGGGVTTAD